MTTTTDVYRPITRRDLRGADLWQIRMDRNRARMSAMSRRWERFGYMADVARITAHDGPAVAAQIRADLATY